GSSETALVKSSSNLSDLKVNEPFPENITGASLVVQWLRFRVISAASLGSVRPPVMELDPTCHDEDRRS
ncbi:hypothetical protein MJT46_009050, partial [Ovis ammon polii x Ovis aries]